jgi:hypothetical protein
MAPDLSCATATDGVITVATGGTGIKLSKTMEQLFKLQMYSAVFAAGLSN